MIARYIERLERNVGYLNVLEYLVLRGIFQRLKY
jgi:hypothetical protein